MRGALFVCLLCGLQHGLAVAQTDSVRSTARPIDHPQGHLPKHLPAKCRAELEESLHALQTVGIRFTVDVEYQVPNLPRVTGESGYIYLDNGRMYYRFERTFPPLPNRPNIVELEEIAYDGHVYHLGKNSASGTPSIKKFLGDNPDSTQALQQSSKTCLYLEAAGYRLPRKVAQWRGGRLTSVVLDYLSEGEVARVGKDGNRDSLVQISMTIPDPAILNAQTMDLDLLEGEMEQNGSDRAAIEQEIGAIKQLQSSDRRRRVDLWLDPEKKCAVVRRVESTSEGQVIFEIESEDFAEFGDGKVWLPKFCTIKTFVEDTSRVRGFTDEPNRTDSIQLESISFQPQSDISFELDYGPGTFIVDQSSHAAKLSQSGEVVSIEPASLDELRDAANANRAGHWIIVANVLLLVLLGGLAIRKYQVRK